MKKVDPPRVLVVEDQPLLRIHANLALQEAGYTVIEAGDASEALAQLSASPDVDAVFTDVKMPGPIDGLGLAHELRKAHPDLPIVVTSGAGSIPADALPEGGVFLAKPYTAAQIARVLGDGMR